MRPLAARRYGRNRARFDNTVIGKGTKIDNLVQLAHNVRIGENCIIVYDANDMTEVFKQYGVTNPEKANANGKYIAFTTVGSSQKSFVCDITSGRIIYETEGSFYRWHKDHIYVANKLIHKIVKIVDTNECVICAERLADRYAIVPCGHTSICYDCIKKVTKCPICNGDITMHIKLY